MTRSLRNEMTQALNASLVPPYRVEIRDPALGWQVSSTHSIRESAERAFERCKLEAPHCAAKIVRVHPSVAQCWEGVADYEPKKAMYRVIESDPKSPGASIVWGHFFAFSRDHAIRLCREEQQRAPSSPAPVWHRVFAERV